MSHFEHFQADIKIFFKLIPDIYYKSPEMCKVLLEKSFEFFLKKTNICFLYKYISFFILDLSSINIILEKKNCK